MMFCDLDLSQLGQEFEKHKEKFFENYFSLLRFKSISTDSQYQNELLACKDWLEQFFKSIDCTTELWPTDDNPTLFVQTPHVPDKPTLLIYGHYDVQPEDPIEKWDTDPFEPIVKDGKVWARGAQDNKGQLAISLALMSYLHTLGPYPCNIKFCIEGGEEIGSGGLIKIVEEKKEQLSCDSLLVIDSELSDENTPAITMSLRGVAALELVVTGSNTDLHSGFFGGLAYNPIHGIVQILDSMRDRQTGKILVEGFYDDVTMPSEEDMAKLDMELDPEDCERVGVKPVGGEVEMPAVVRNWLRPTLEINGIYGGYMKEGSKTVIPSTAGAKITCRLVHNQDPNKIKQHIKDHIYKHLPDGLQVEILGDQWDAAEPTRAAFGSSILTVVDDALTEVFTNSCKYIMCGATIGVTGPLHQAAGGDLVIMGFGVPQDNIHAPNESFGLDRFKKGFLTLARVIQKLAQ